uniref:Cytochrome P450 n=1 Tax=Panagrolaimus davidi TaxID=227884 RepID=A0A914PEZ8_9BILA
MPVFELNWKKTYGDVFGIVLSPKRFRCRKGCCKSGKKAQMDMVGKKFDPLHLQLSQLMHQIIHERVIEFTKVLKFKCRENDCIDIYDEFQALTLDVIGRTAFGIEADSLNDRNDEFYVNARKIVAAFTLEKTPLIWLSTGYETTSTALAYASWHLAMDQDVQHRLFEEIEDTIGDGDADYDTAMKLPYLDAVFHEVLRLSPPVVTFTMRTCIKETEVKGYKFLPGMNVGFGVQCIHWNEELWPEPLKFVGFLRIISGIDFCITQNLEFFLKRDIVKVGLGL